jgi:hypothetical protein
MALDSETARSAGVLADLALARAVAGDVEGAAKLLTEAYAKDPTVRSRVI